MGVDLSSWWTLPGPSAFVGRVMKAAINGNGVTVLQVPSPRPKGLVDAIAARFAEEMVLRTVMINGQDLNSERSVAHELVQSCGLLGSGIGNIADFVRSRELSQVVFIVDGLSRQDLLRWGLFVRALREERRRSSLIAGPFLLIVAPPGLAHAENRQLTGDADHCLWLGSLSRLDSAAWLGCLGVRQGSTLLERIGLATVIELAAWSVDLLETFAGLDTEEQVWPVAKLEALAQGQQWAFPCWENGLVDLWEDVPIPHAVAALAHGIPHEIERRIWTAQNSVILPFVDEVRRGIIRKYFDALEKHANPTNPYRKTVFDRELIVDSPWQFEWHELRLFLEPILPPDETKFFKACRWARDQMAHARPIGLENLKALSSWWEALRDVHVAGVPGWDWPRAGQILTLTIGPAIAGRSTWAAEQDTPVISCDDVHQELLASRLPKDRSMVLREARRRAANLMRSGSHTIIDATNIEAEERLQNVNLAPPDIPVRYVVMDCPLTKNPSDGNWKKAGSGLIANNSEQSQLDVTNMLKGDGRANVSVIDLRPKTVGETDDSSADVQSLAQ
jgi:predicted kinase